MSPFNKDPAGIVQANHDRAVAVALLMILRDALSPNTNTSLEELLGYFEAVIHDTRHEAVQDALAEYRP